VILSANLVIVCLQETKLSDIGYFKAKTFLPTDFQFAFKPSEGSRGGIVTAWNPNIFSLTDHFIKPYSITCALSCNLSNLDINVTNTYGPSNHTESPGYLQFICELPPLIAGPWLLLGDFNLVRQPSDKNNGQINFTLANAFNETIESICVSEIHLSDRLYTWSNQQTHPVLAKLDRVFSNNELNATFPLANLSSLPKPTSDHFPLLLTLCTEIPKPIFFRFEKHWLHNQNFLPSILAGWQSTVVTGDAAGGIAARLKATWAAVKVWTRCNRAPHFLIPNSRFIIQLFDYYEETRSLSVHELQARRHAQEQLHFQVKQKAAYWKQRSKQKAIQESDANTKFHHAVATQRLISNYIRMVQVDGTQIVNHDGKISALTSYFKSILGVSRDSQPTPLAELYANSYNPDSSINSPFTEAEVKQAVLSMNMNSAPGPDGFEPIFYKAAWGVVKPNLMKLMHDFHSGQVDLQRINRSHMVLLPKKPGTAEVSAFRPIALQNCCFKILSKVLTTRLQTQIPRLIDINQTGFIRGRSIADTFVYALELLQVCHKRKKTGNSAEA